ncbi:MAG TPA: hypothetical protein VE687_04905 [Stellaceae bacterium]|nr:hypothetical protein [Stellaceae bacterium]
MNTDIFIVIAGHDPAILLRAKLGSLMHAQVKPGHDDNAPERIR